jgi:hypothetical protein
MRTLESQPHSPFLANEKSRIDGDNIRDLMKKVVGELFFLPKSLFVRMRKNIKKLSELLLQYNPLSPVIVQSCQLKNMPYNHDNSMLKYGIISLSIS